MQKSLPVFLAIIGVCAATFAQDAPAKPVFVPTATPEATPEPKSPGVLQRLFGSRQNRPPVVIQPMPAPKIATATPAPTVPQAHAKTPPKPKAAKIATNAASPDAAPAIPKPHGKKPRSKVKMADAETDPAMAKPDAPENVKPAPEKPEPPAPEAPAPIKKPRKGKGTPATAAKEGVEPPPDGDPEAREKFRFDQAKAKAAEDPEVQELKAKADSAVSDEDARSAQRAYNKALFNKMRKIDGTLDERINSMEAAILKRLDGK